MLAAYASVTPAPDAFIDGMIAHGQLKFDSHRTDGTTKLSASASRDGAFTTGAVSAGIDRPMGPFRWSAYGRAEYLDGVLNAFRETGAGIYDLRFDGRAVRSVSGVLGFRTDYRRSFLFGLLSASLRGEWQHEFTGGTAQGLDYANVTGPSFYSIEALGWAREQFTVEPGVTVALPSGWEFGVDFGVRAADRERAATSSVKVRKTF